MHDFVQTLSFGSGMTNGGSQSGAAAAAQAAINGSRSNSLSTGSELRLDVEISDMIQEEMDGQQGDDDSEVEQVWRGRTVSSVSQDAEAS